MKYGAKLSESNTLYSTNLSSSYSIITENALDIEHFRRFSIVDILFGVNSPCVYLKLYLSFVRVCAYDNNLTQSLVTVCAASFPNYGSVLYSASSVKSDFKLKLDNHK